MTNHNKGIAAALFCFIFWGVGPIYFKLLQNVPADIIIAHRIIWGVLFLLLFLLIREQKHIFTSLKISLKHLMGLLLSGTLVTSNWLVFVWAVNNDQILATSLGYFINPLVNILLGVLILHERLNKTQLVAVLLATSATVYLGYYIGEPPWISLYLAFSFGLYGLLRKQLDVRPLIGLFWENLLLLLPATIYLFYFAPSYQYINNEQLQIMLLVFAGLVTILPLIGFNYAAKQLPLTLLGFFQYIAPTISFLIAVYFYGEEFTFGHKVAFFGIWSALLIISVSPFRKLFKNK